MNAGLLRFVVHHGENKRPGSLCDQCIDWHQKRVFLSLDADFHDGIHARSKFQFGIRQFDFSQHGFAGLIQCVGKPRDFAVETSTGQAIDRHLDRLIDLDERCFQFGDGDLNANSVEIRQSDDCGILRSTARGGRRNERAGIDHALADDAGKRSDNFGVVKQRFRSLQIGFGNVAFALGVIYRLRDHQVRRFLLRFAQAFVICLRHLYLRLVSSAIGLQFRNFNFCQQRAFFDLVALVHGDCFQIARDLGVKRGLLVWFDFARQRDVPGDRAALRRDDLHGNGWSWFYC